VVASQKFPGAWDQKEAWYGTEYTLEKIPADFLTEIERAFTTGSPEFHMPLPNLFIPRHLELKNGIKESPKEPKLIRNNNGVRVWYKPEIRAPNASLFIHCRNVHSNDTAKSCSKALLYTHLVKHLLLGVSYDAKLAKLKYKLDTCPTGFLIQISGWDEMFPVLLEKVLTAMTGLETQLGYFGSVKEELLRSYRNTALSEPWHQAFRFMNLLNVERGYFPEQIVNEAQHLTAADVEGFCSDLLGQMEIEIFVHGNIYKRDALRFADMAVGSFKPRPLPKTQWTIARSLSFPPGSDFICHRNLSSVLSDNCIQYSLYLGDRFDGPARAKAFLLDQMTSEPAFDQLRTKEQLGYVVFGELYENNTSINYGITIQGEKAPGYLEDRIDSFLAGFAKSVATMPKPEFKRYKISAAGGRLKKPNNLKEESSRLWSHIYGGYLDFKLGASFV
jgi:insulysin